MSAASTIKLPGAAHPDAALVLLMIASAACGGPGIDAAGAARASAAVDQVLGVATARGFRDADIFRELVRRQRQGLVGTLADNAIVAVGGPAKFFALLDRSSAAGAQAGGAA